VSADLDGQGWIWFGGTLRIPHAVAKLEVTADVRAGMVTCPVDVAAPRDGRTATRVNWLVRQLKNEPETVRVEAFTAHSRGASSVTARHRSALKDSTSLIDEDCPKVDRSYENTREVGSE
jgi:hypothetical protein